MLSLEVLSPEQIVGIPRKYKYVDTKVSNLQKIVCCAGCISCYCLYVMACRLFCPTLIVIYLHLHFICTCGYGVGSSVILDNVFVPSFIHSFHRCQLPPLLLLITMFLTLWAGTCVINRQAVGQVCLGWDSKPVCLSYLIRQQYQ